MQNLKKNWLVVWKMIWEIWQIFIRTLENVKIGIFVGSFCPKYKMLELQTHRGVITNDTEEWWKIWKGTDLSFQNWRKKFFFFYIKHLHVKHKKYNHGCLWPKYITFGLKEYRGAIVHDTRVWCKFWRKADLWFGKWHEELSKFSPEHTKFTKLGLSLDPFIH